MINRMAGQSALRKLLATFIACLVTLPAAADTLIFGGTRGVGLETARLLVEQGEAVTVMVRSTSDVSGLNEIDGVETVVGDAMEPESMATAFASREFNRAVSTLSGKPEEGFAVDSVGKINAIEAAKAAGVEHFVLVSSIGVGDSAGALPPPALKALAAVLAEKAKAEDYLVQSGVGFTVIRPGALTRKPANGNGILSEDASLGGIISRAEVARLVVESINNAEAQGKIYSAIEQK